MSDDREHHGVTSRALDVHTGRAKEESGFSLIELLVVVVILGVLIAIAVPLYLNYRKGASDKAAGSDLRGAITVLEKCNAENEKYPDAVPTTGGSPTGDTCTSATINLSAGSSVQYVVKSDKKSYIVWTRNGGGGKVYCFASETGGGIKNSTATAFPTATYAASCG